MDLTIGDVVNKIKEAIHGEPVVLLTLVIPLLTVLGALGIHLPAATIAAIETGVLALTTAIARGKVTPAAKAAVAVSSAQADSFKAGFDAGVKASSTLAVTSAPEAPQA